MSNSKDYNADLGDQTITDTEPPLVFEATVVSADEPIIIAPPTDSAAENLDAQLDALLSADEPTVVTVKHEKKITIGNAEPISFSPDADLDAELDALLNNRAEPAPAEPVILTPPPSDTSTESLDAQLDSLLSADEPAPVATSAYLDEQLDAMLNGDLATPTPSQNAQSDNLDAQLDALLNNPAEPASAEPIILTPPLSDTSVENLDARLDSLLSTDVPAPATPAAKPDATINEQPAEPIIQAQPVVAEQQQAQPEPSPAPVPEPTAQPRDSSAEAEAAKLMMEQALMMMKQAQEAQAQAVAQTVQAAAVKTQPPEPRKNDADAEATKEMLRQAQMMLQQAQATQMQAQAAAQAAQASPAAASPDASSKEVDRLKAELDGMRDLVNKLTISLAQHPQQQQQQAAPQSVQPPYYFAAGMAGMDNDHYRKLETELERMRREIIEKDLRDKEKELERKQKEAENTVKDIRPEMIQMSDSRDIAPAPAMGGGGIGGEYIPLANGVYYSTKDRQIYVMTPASNAAAAKPTIEQPRPAPVKRAAPPPKRAAAKPSAKRHAARRPSAHGRPGGAHRRPLGRPRPKR